jgi:opacity protein-like surface antigen
VSRPTMTGMLAVACIFAITLGAEAQPARSAPKHASVGLSVGTVAGIATDDSEARRVFAGSMRFDLTRRLAVDVELAHWGTEKTDHFGPGVITIAERDGTFTYGHKESSTTRDTDSRWETAVNLVAHSTGRVSIFGGGGVGFGVSRSVYSSSSTGCTAPSRPQVCDPYTQIRNGSGVSLGVIGGVDVAVTERFAGFASLRARTGYLYGPHHVGALAGVRFRIR